LNAIPHGTAEIAETTPGSALTDQPTRIVQRGGVEFTLLGTAHVSRRSAEAVSEAIDSGRFDAVAVELCEARCDALRRPDALHRLDLFDVLRQGKAGMVAANLALSAYQRRLADQLGIEPGAEMKAAIAAAERDGLPLHCIDRDVGLTLKRVQASMGWWERSKVISGLIASTLVDDKVDEAEIERLKEGDILESTFAEFANRSQSLYTSLIAERDRYMAARLRQIAAAPDAPRRVLAVVGAGHLAGLAQALAESPAAPEAEIAQVSSLPPPGRWGLWITLILAVLVVGGFAWGFSQGADIGTEVVLQWVLVTGTLGAIGCLLAGGHPFSILGAFVASPLTPLHPALASGTVSAAIETWVRKPTVADFASLREDSGSVRGWWRNRVTRILLNFFLTSFGTAIGVYLAGWKMLQALLA
jgi:pheromone shutdown-related protein TraB